MRKQLVACMLILALFTLALTGCAPKADAPSQSSSSQVEEEVITDISDAMQKEYRQKYLLSTIIPIAFDNWDNINDVDVNHIMDVFLLYRMSSYLDELMRKKGISDYNGFPDFYDASEEKVGPTLNWLYVSEEEVESFLQTYFEVSSEHLRTSEYYRPEKRAYFLTAEGGFGGVGLIIDKIVKKGNMEYIYFGLDAPQSILVTIRHDEDGSFKILSEKDIINGAVS